MPDLKSLSFTTIPKTGNDPVQARRAKFVSKLEEQKLLLKDPNHVRTVQRWTKVNGERQATTKQQAVRPWWKTDPAGQVVISIKFGARPIEFEGQSRHRRPFQGKAAGGHRHPDLGRSCRGAGRAVQPSGQDRVDLEGALPGDERSSPGKSASYLSKARRRYFQGYEDSGLRGVSCPAAMPSAP
jgi:hypothetical protein